MAEDFAFDKRFRNRRAVDRDKGPRLARAQIVECACHQFLAGSALAGDEHRLTDLLIQLRNFRMPRRKSSRGALAMDPDTFANTFDIVLLELRDVVRHVVDQIHAQVFPRTTEDLREHLARLPH